MVLQEIGYVRRAGGRRRASGSPRVRLIHRRMHELAIARRAMNDEPAIAVAFERIRHGHAGAALLDAKHGVRLSLIATDADRFDAHVHRGHIDAVGA